MKRTVIPIGSLVVIFLACSAFAADQAAKTLSRYLDPVVVTGKMSDLTGEPIGHYGLYAMKNGRFSPIPFQIDERDAEGKFVLTQGKQAAKYKDDTGFDDNDELVFMAMDSGDKIPDKTSLPKGIKACTEIEVADPVSKEKAWVYLLTQDSPLEKSPIDYVFYDPATPTFKTRNYSGEYNKKFPAGASKYTFEAGVGGNGTDFIDRIKVRVLSKSMGISLIRTEEDILVEELGYIDGPVRVVVYTKNTTPLFLGIPASTTRQYTYYYDMYADFAFTVAFPIKPGYFRATVLDDFKDARGWTFYNSNNLQGLLIDGKMDDTDRKLDLSPWTWCVLSNGALSFWSVWITPPGCPVKASLYYKDDMNAKDPLEENLGETPGLGFDFNIGWNKLKEDHVEIRLLHFFTKGYKKGMEESIRNVYDNPLKASMLSI